MCTRQDSNLRPVVYKTTALPTELRVPTYKITLCDYRQIFHEDNQDLRVLVQRYFY